MKLEWDFQELYDFADRLTQFDKFQEACKEVVKQLATELREMLFAQTPVRTGQLAAGWGGAENYAFKIEELKTSYKITLYNRVPYAKHVNDGHYSYNQFNKGGQPYVVKNRTPKMHTVEGAIMDDTYVFGHFFVEKSILLMEQRNDLDALLERELYKWFGWCVDG